MSARSVINRFGKTLSYRKNTDSSTYDPAKGTVSGQYSEDWTVKGYFFNYVTSEVPGTPVVTGKRKLMITPYDILGEVVPEPEEDDKLLGDGDTVTVTSVEKIMKGDNVEVYVLIVKE